MKRLILIAALALIGCGENKSSTYSQFSGNYFATGKACTGSGIFWTCSNPVASVTACAGVTKFDRIYVDHDAIFGTLGTGEYSHLTITANLVKHDTTGISYRQYEKFCEATDGIDCTMRAPAVFEFAPGCNLEFDRGNYN